MKLFALLLVLVLVAGCQRQSEHVASSDEALQRKLAGVWVHKRTLKSGPDVVATLQVNPDGTFSGTSIFSKPLPDGLGRLEQSGTWRIEDGFLVMTVTSSSLTNAQLPEEGRVQIVRLDERELEYKPAESIEGIEGVYIATNHIIYRRQTR